MRTIQCPTCNGSGLFNGAACATCHGTGEATERAARAAGATVTSTSTPARAATRGAATSSPTQTQALVRALLNDAATVEDLLDALQLLSLSAAGEKGDAVDALGARVLASATKRTAGDVEPEGDAEGADDAATPKKRPKRARAH